MSAMRSPFVATAALVCAVLSSSIGSGHAVPVAYNINQGNRECVLERLEADEHMTVSMFITSGAQLKGSIMVQGPVSPIHGDGSGKDETRMMVQDMTNYDRGSRYGLRIKYGSVPPPKGTRAEDFEIAIDDKVDFEAVLTEQDEERAMDYDDYMEEEDDEYPRLYHDIVGDDDFMTEEERAKREEQFEAAKQKIIQKKGGKQQLDKPAELGKGGIRREGEPWEVTVQVKVPGIYRACISAGWHPISAELDIRKSSDVGKPDLRTGHLMTQERRAMIAAEKYFVQDAAKDRDLKETHNMIRHLTRMLGEIKRKQDIERHQLNLHKSVNAHSHSRMVMGSLIETLLYMLITGYQVYAIRSWFKGSPLLGR